MRSLQVVVLASFLFASAPSAAWAQASHEKLRDHWRDVASLTFSQTTTIEAFGRQVSYSGTWAWERETARFRLDLLYESGPFVKVYDGSSLWTYDAESETYTREPQEEDVNPQDSENQDVLALLDGGLFDRPFELKDGSFKDKPALVVTARSPDDQDFRLTYWFSTEDHVLLGIGSDFMDGDEAEPLWRSEYSNIVLNPEELEEGTFVFEAPEGAREVAPEEFLKGGGEGGDGQEAEPAGGGIAEAEGDFAPEIATVDTDGEKVALSGLQGKVVILDFWATWCPPCRLEIPGFVALQEQYGEAGLVVVGVSDEDDQTVKGFAKENSMNYRLWRQPPGLEWPYNTIRAIPTTLVIDRQGMIRHVHVGFTAKEVFEEQVRELLDEG